MHRFTCPQGIELIKHFEGFKAQPYVCAGGYLTIGYGHKLLPSDKYRQLDEAKALKILQMDLRRTERAVLKYINHELSDNQFAALVSFTFNLGPAALQRSSLRSKVNYGQFKQAAREFNRWVYAGGRKLSGLVRRRKAEATLFLLDYGTAEYDG